MYMYFISEGTRVPWIFPGAGPRGVNPPGYPVLVAARVERSNLGHSGKSIQNWRQISCVIVLVLPPFLKKIKCVAMEDTVRDCPHLAVFA